MLSNLDFSSEKHIIFVDDFNLFLNCSLNAKGGCPSLKKHSLSKLLETKQKLDLCVYGEYEIQKRCSKLLRSIVLI